MPREVPFAWLRPDRSRIIINPPAGMTITRVPIMIEGRGLIMAPGVAMSLKPESIDITSVIIERCKAQDIRPTIHVWDRYKQIPQFAVMFVIRDPDQDFLCALFPYNTGEIRAQQWAEIRLLFTARCPAKYIEVLCADYRTTRAASVLIVGDVNLKMGMLMIDELDPIAHLVARDLELTQPVAILDVRERPK